MVRMLAKKRAASLAEQFHSLSGLQAFKVSRPDLPSPSSLLINYARYNATWFQERKNQEIEP
jgi:hypothetical protein